MLARGRQPLLLRSLDAVEHVELVLPRRDVCVVRVAAEIADDLRVVGAEDDARSPAPGPVVDEIWSFQPGGALAVTTLQVSGTYDVVVGDYDGDGHEDLLWSGHSLAASYRWSGQADGSLVSSPAG